MKHVVLYQPSTFFTEQLTAFEVWLDHGSEHKKPPEQLPIILQVRSISFSWFPFEPLCCFIILLSGAVPYLSFWRVRLNYIFLAEIVSIWSAFLIIFRMIDICQKDVFVVSIYSLNNGASYI